MGFHPEHDEVLEAVVRDELTDLGLSLQHVMRGIKGWAETHMDEVLANREEYDTRVA